MSTFLIYFYEFVHILKKLCPIFLGVITTFFKYFNYFLIFEKNGVGLQYFSFKNYQIIKGGKKNERISNIEPMSKLKLV